jgi:hypothetical protein
MKVLIEFLPVQHCFPILKKGIMLCNWVKDPLNKMYAIVSNSGRFIKIPLNGIKKAPDMEVSEAKQGNL